MIDDKDSCAQDTKEEQPMLGFLVSEGAGCTCTFAVDPGPKKLKVISQRKYLLSHANGHLLATTNDNNISALNFGNCKMPDPSHPVPCTANLGWANYYTEIKLPGNAYPLTENSVATCTAKGGIVRIVKHGQDAASPAPLAEDMTTETGAAADGENDADNTVNESEEPDDEQGAAGKPVTESKPIRGGKKRFQVLDDTVQQKVRPGELITFTVTPGPATGELEFWQVMGEGDIISTTGNSITLQAGAPGSSCGVVAHCEKKQLYSAMVESNPNRLKAVDIERTVLVNDLLVLDLDEYFELPPRGLERQQVKWYCSTDSSFENYYGSTLRYSFSKEGVYRLEPYLDCFGKELTITVTVKCPKLLFASWRDGLGYVKFVTGWKERNHLSLVFRDAANQEVLVSFGAQDKQSGRQVMLQTGIRKKIVDDRVSIVFVAEKDKAKALKEGMYFFATVKFANPHYASDQDRLLQPARLMRLKCDPEIIAVRFFKNDKQVFKAVYGETLEGKVWTRNLVYRDLAIEIYRKEARKGIDWLRKDTLVFSCTAYVNSDGFACFKFKLDSSFKDQYKENFHSFYVKVKDQQGGTNAMIMAFPEPTENKKKNGKAASVIQQLKIKGKKEVCDACSKEITISEILEICKDVKGRSLIREMKHINGAIDFLNSFREKSGLTRCIRKAHFLAQVAEETKFYKLDEQFNYSAAGLIETFARFRTAEGQRKAGKWGRGPGSDVPVSQANQENIANWVYAGINGNSKDVSVGDGWRYRGKGFIQLTGKGNYKEASAYFNKYFGGGQKDWVADPDSLIQDPKDAMATALVFWKSRHLSARADTGITEASLSFVTKPLNDALKNFNERAYFLERAVQTLNVNNCIHYIAGKDQKGSIVVVKGQGHHYINGFVVYETLVWRNLTLERYQQEQQDNSLRDPDFVTYLSRDAWDTKYYDKQQKKHITVKHDDRRYGSYNEAPPGTYYLFAGSSGQKYSMYLGDRPGNATINGPHGERGGIAIHHFSPNDSQGCLTTVSFNDLYPVRVLKEEIPDLVFQTDKRPVRIILEERKVSEANWENKENGTIKWTGRLD